MSLFKKVTIVLFDVLVIVSLIWLAMIAVKAQSEPDFRLNVTTDKGTYEYSEDIQVTFEAENFTGSDLILKFSTGCQINFNIFQFNSEIGGYSFPAYNDILYPRNCSDSPTLITIPDNKKAIWTRTIDGQENYPTLFPGDYVLHGYIVEHETEDWYLQQTSLAKFTIEPSTEFSDVVEEFETLCEGTGGEVTGSECQCSAGLNWDDYAGCQVNLSNANRCIETGGIIPDSTEENCICSTEGDFFNVVDGCTDQPSDTFNDIEGHWAEDYILDLRSRGIVSGYDDGGYHPDAFINRAELVKMSLSAAGTTLEDSTGDLNFLFNDLDEWQVEWVYTAWKNSIVQGYNETTFAPAKNVTRAEAVKIALLAFDVEVPDTSDEWAFEDTIDHWSLSYINKAYLEFIVSGRTEDLFFPDDPITRAEAAKVINKLLN